MRRAISTLAVAILVGAVAVPSGAGENGRTVTAPYQGSNGITGSLSAFWTLPGGSEAPTFHAKRGERSVDISIVDQAGTVAIAHVHINHDRSGDAEVHKDVCGSTDQPLRIPPGARIRVWPMMGTCDDGTPAIATQGVVEITFHK